MSRSVVVTGAGGFVGSAVLRRLVARLERGPVNVGDNEVSRAVGLLRPNGSAGRINDLSPSAKWSTDHADILDAVSMQAALERANPVAILHLALDEREMNADHPDGAPMGSPLSTLFEVLSGTDGARVVHTGSAWALAPGDQLAEEAELRPRSPYARNKVRAERALPELQARTGVEWINLRPFNIFGKHERPSRLVPYLVMTLSEGRIAKLSHGAQIRDFTDVDAIADAYLRALEAPPTACGRTYHLGSGMGTTTRDLAAMVAEVTGNAHLLRFGAGTTEDQDVPVLVADPSRARRTLGWSSPPDLRRSVHDVVGWWLQQRPFERVVEGRPLSVPPQGAMA